MEEKRAYSEHTGQVLVNHIINVIYNIAGNCKINNEVLDCIKIKLCPAVQHIVEDIIKQPISGWRYNSDKQWWIAPNGTSIILEVSESTLYIEYYKIVF